MVPKLYVVTCIGVCSKRCGAHITVVHMMLTLTTSPQKRSQKHRERMRALCHNCILNAVGAAKPPLSPPPPPSPNTKHKPNPFLSFSSSVNSNKWHQKLLLHALTGALSFNLLISSPSASIAEILSPPSPPEVCKEEDFQKQQAAEAVPEFVSNGGIVEEAWEIVNEGFLDAGNLHRWSPDKWKQKKEDITGSSIQTRSKAHDIIQRMLASLGDPYTRFLSPSEFSKMGRYDMTGIGINLREVPDDNGTIKVQVLGIILDGPAHVAGVRQGDEILTVNGVDVRGKSAFEVSSLLQGPNETFVTIEVKHGNCGPIQSIDVQRRLVARTPVFYRLEEKKNGSASVGYIRIKEFNALAMKDLVIAMKRLQDSGASFYILDLRDNLGGLVQAGIEVAKLFLNEGDTVIYTVGKDPQYQKNVIAETAPVVTAPVIVLVNSKTASASEIVASALHDNCRAVLVGERTYGKGLIQSVFELHDGSGIVVTVGKYVTPNHMEINGNGIEPDFRSIPDWAEVDKYLSQCHRKSNG